MAQLAEEGRALSMEKKLKRFTRLKTALGASLLTMTAFATSAHSQEAACGGDFNTWKQGFLAEAEAKGVGPFGLQALERMQPDPEVLNKDRSQGVFTLDFLTFSKRLISQNRMDNGRANLQRYASVFDRVRSEFGVAPEIITSFWAFETDYGAIQGDFKTLNAIATLAHDCRRPELFRPQLIALGQLIDQRVVQQDVTGAWAGEIGMIQVLPEDYLMMGRDGDGDDRVTLKESVPDALLTGANFLRSLGWRPNEPWLQEVIVPAEMEWYDAGLHQKLPVSEWQARGVNARDGALASGLEASLLLPMGRRGPAFLAYPNFNVLLEWNQSLTYVLTAAYFGTRLAGAPVYNEGSGHNGLTVDQTKLLQEKLAAKGYDVGKIDGVIGAGTRDAVRNEQRRLGLPADAWPTPELLNAL